LVQFPKSSGRWAKPTSERLAIIHAFLTLLMEGSEKLTEAEEEGTGGDYAFMLSGRQGKDGGIFFCEVKKKNCVHMRW
jgi:hypothetical protein